MSAKTHKPDVDVCKKLLTELIGWRFCGQTTQQWQQIVKRGSSAAATSVFEQWPQLGKHGLAHVHLGPTVLYTCTDQPSFQHPSYVSETHSLLITQQVARPTVFHGPWNLEPKCEICSLSQNFNTSAVFRELARRIWQNFQWGHTDGLPTINYS